MVFMQGDQGQYNPFGMRLWSANSNCHNTTTTSLERSGVSQQQILDINKELRTEGGRRTPGLKNSFSTPTATQVVSQRISSAWDSVQQTFSNIINKLK